MHGNILACLRPHLWCGRHLICHGFAVTPFPRNTVTYGSSCTVIFDQVRKALLRLTLCRQNLPLRIRPHLRAGAREYFAAGKISLTSRSDVTHSALRATFLSRKGSVALDFMSAKLAAVNTPAPSCGRTSFVTASPCHLPLEGKAWLRSKFLTNITKVR